MRIVVTRTIDVPDDLDSVNSLESLIREEGFALMRDLLGEAWQRLQGLRLSCRHCGSNDVERAGHKEVKLLTAFGSVRISRQRIKCRECGNYSQPQDEWLEELGEHRMSLFVQELSALAGASWPYAASEEIVGRILLGQVSHEQIRRVATGEGARVAAKLEAEAEKVQEAVVFDEGEDESRGLNVVLDGDWVRSRDNHEGMEAKVGVVYSGVERIGKDRRRLLNRRYAATFKDSTLLGKLVYAEASKLDVERVGKIRLLGDGARWIDTVGQEQFSGAERVLDLWHLERQLSRGLKAAIRGRLGSEDELRRLRAKLGGQIRRGEVDEVLQALRGLVESDGGAEGPVEVPKELAKTIVYIEGHRDTIIDYEAEQKAGKHVGSGAVEKLGDLAVNRRFKGHRGMRWWRKNANGILALRILRLNSDWDGHWQGRRDQPAKAA